jgi:hypothetical protein
MHLTGDADAAVAGPELRRAATQEAVLLGRTELGLVSIPVRLAVATEKKNLAFHLLHR